MKLLSCSLEGRTGHEAGRMLLARLYREATGEDLPPIALTDRGKPYFENSPWHFSITHTRRHAFCVLARENVGLDAEELDRPLRPGLEEKILSPGELQRYRAAKDPRRALLALWVLKEAEAKYTGLGLQGYPNHTDFSPDDPRVRELEGCLVALITDNTKENTHAL